MLASCTASRSLRVTRRRRAEAGASVSVSCGGRYAAPGRSAEQRQGGRGVAAGQGKAEQPVAPEQEHPTAAREQPGDGGIANIEPARIGAERRQHQPPCVGDEARPRNDGAACGDVRFRVVVAADFSCTGLGGCSGGGTRTVPGRLRHSAAGVPAMPAGGSGSWFPSTQTNAAKSAMAASRAWSACCNRPAPAAS